MINDITDFSGSDFMSTFPIDAKGKNVETRGTTVRFVPSILSADDLLSKKFPEPKYAVPGILPEGLTVLVGKPKLGKSWLVLGIAIAVASGGRVLGNISVEKGDVLYLGLEDGERRLQSRLRGVLNDGPIPTGLFTATHWRGIADGGLDGIEGWLQDHPSARLVVIDTLKRIRPPDRAGRLYDGDYDAVAPLGDLAKRYGVSIVVVHHTRKMDGEDPVDLVSGSTGLTGAADGICVLTRQRKHTGAELFATGRDFEERSLALEWDNEILQWRSIGDASTFRMSEERRAIIDVIKDHGGTATPKFIAEALDKKPGTVRKNLSDMKSDGQVISDSSGNYSINEMLDNTGNIGNSEPMLDDQHISPLFEYDIGSNECYNF